MGQSEKAPLFRSCIFDALSSCQAARERFGSQIKKLSVVERGTSISINREVDLGETALYIAAEDDSLISHSSVPLPVEAFIERLDDLSMDYCSHYSSSFRSSPEKFLECLDRYLYFDKVYIYCQYTALCWIILELCFFYVAPYFYVKLDLPPNLPLA
ncbi:hypothetical protein LguiB_010713 [Lonicera macranthoides]